MLVFFFLVFQGPNQSVSAEIKINNSDGLKMYDRLFNDYFYPYDFIYDNDTEFYLTDGTYLGEMVHIAYDSSSRTHGRTFAHPSTYYAWGEAFGGNPSYVRDNTRVSLLERKSDGKIFYRSHSVELGIASGAIVTPVYANNQLERVVVEPSPFPTGSYTNEPVGIVGEDFTLSLSAQEYNPHTQFLRYEVWANNYYKVHTGTVDQNSVSNLKIPLNFTSGGNRPITIRLFDSVNRQTNIQGSIYLNHRPVADFNMNPSPTDRLKSVLISTNATDADGDSLSYRYEYRLKGDSSWRYLSNSANRRYTFPEVGTYEVRQTVTDTYDASDSIVKEIVVENNGPTAAFTGTPNPTNRVKTVQFTSQATDPEKDSLTHKYEYREKGQSLWTALSKVQNPTFVFPKIGTYEVRQTVTDTYNASDSTIREIVVENVGPVADFSWSPSVIYMNTTVTLKNASTDADNDPLTYQWSFQEPGSTIWRNFSTLKDPSNVFNKKGIWNVRLNVSDGALSDSVVKAISVENRPPAANFSWDPSTIYKDTNVTFENLASDPDNDTLTYQWAYQEPGTSTWVNFSSALNPARTFAKKGSWNIRLTVNDGAATAVSSKTLTVSNRAPVSNFSWNPATIYNNTSVNLVSAASDPDDDAITYQWAYQKPNSTTWVNFSTSANPSKIFDVKGNWNIRLSVSDGSLTHSTTKVLNVQNRPPVANFSWNPTTIYNNTSVTLTNASNDVDKDALSYQWAYQEPNSTTWVNFSTTASPSKIFDKKGSWNVRLTVSDGAASHSVTKTLTVQNRPPVASFNWSPATIYSHTTVTMNNTSSDADNDALTYQWAYQEPGSTTWVNFSTALNPARVYAKKGTWNIRLTVSDGAATHSLTKALIVQNRPPVANFNWSPTTIFNNTNVTFANSSTDPDNDSLTYQWAYQEPNSTAWVNYSTAENPTRVFSKKGTWNIRLMVSDGAATHSVTKLLTVQNRPPVASFNWSPTTIYNNTNVTFENGSTDSDNDALTYQWAYQKPNSSSWINFSTAENPSRIFTEKGTWNIRLTTSDGTSSHSTTKALTVTNRSPIPAFNWNPVTIHTNTTVTFNNESTDPDSDPLTNQWAYQKPGSTTWTNFSTEKNPTQVFGEKGTWNIRLTVTDGTETKTLTKQLVVRNTPPKVSLTYSPSNIYEGDTVTLTAIPTDLDGDKMTVILEQNLNGTWNKLKEVQNVDPGAAVTFSYVADPQSYSIRARAIDDSNGTGEAIITFAAEPLEIKGVVKHTADWEKIHAEAGHLPDQFYSGERFLTEALVTDHPIEKVTVSFAGEQITGNLLTLLLPMVERAHPVYEVEVYESITGNPDEHLTPGMAYFVFEATWENGVVKQHRVSVNIVSDVYGAFDFYRSN